MMVVVMVVVVVVVVVVVMVVVMVVVARLHRGSRVFCAGLAGLLQLAIRCAVLRARFTCTPSSRTFSAESEQVS